MSNRHEVEGRTIHPRALEELGEEACIVALGVARDLRSGVIPPEKYDQGRYMHACGAACCIAGHMRDRLGLRGHFTVLSPALMDLFGGLHPSIPHLAVDAIERYIYDGSETPWTPT